MSEVGEGEGGVRGKGGVGVGEGMRGKARVSKGLGSREDDKRGEGVTGITKSGKGNLINFDG